MVNIRHCVITDFKNIIDEPLNSPARADTFKHKNHIFSSYRSVFNSILKLEFKTRVRKPENERFTFSLQEDYALISWSTWPILVSSYFHFPKGIAPLKLNVNFHISLTKRNHSKIGWTEIFWKKRFNQQTQHSGRI